MVKKILISIASSLAILLVLGLALVVVLTYQDFFGQAITWLLCACIAVLIVFDIYLAVSRIVDAVRRRGMDEESLSEYNLEKMLSGEANQPIAVPVSRSQAQKATAEKQKAKKEAETAKAVQKQAQTEARKAAEQSAKRRKLQEAQALKLAEATAKADHIAAAEEAARKRAKALVNETEKQIALAEADALRRASLEAQQKLQVETEAHSQVQTAAEAEEEAERKAAEERKSRAIESARKQAESLATARRRAAQTAARSQTFTAITSDKLPSFNTQIIEQMADATDTRSLLSSDARQGSSHKRQPDEIHGESIWEKMKVRQSAAPILNNPYGDTARLDTLHPEDTTSAPRSARSTRTGSIAAQAFKNAEPASSALHAELHPENPTPEAQDEPRGSQSTRGDAFRSEVARSAASTASTPPVRPAQKSVAPPPSAATTAPPKAPSAPPRQTNSPATAETDAAKPATPGWSYTPAKLPNAWQTPAQNRKIPGDMSFAGVPVVPASPSAEPTAHSATSAPHKQATASASTTAAKPQTKPTISNPSVAPARPAPMPVGQMPSATDPNMPDAPRKRGRPPKPKTEEELNMPKRPRGRPPKPKTEEELNMPKRPRGRPPKNPVAETDTE